MLLENNTNTVHEQAAREEDNEINQLLVGPCWTTVQCVDKQQHNTRQNKTRQLCFLLNTLLWYKQRVDSLDDGKEAKGDWDEEQTL